jgi:hypothetical protein
VNNKANSFFSSRLNTNNLPMRLTTFIIAFLLLTAPVYAQTIAPEQKSDIALEVFQMTQSMDELMQLLKEGKTQSDSAAELQKLEIAVTYLSFRSRRIESKEQDLRDKKLARDRMQELVTKIKDNPEQWERFDRTAQRQSQIQPTSQENPVDYRLRQLEERIETLDSEIITLEMEVTDLNRELSNFEAYVQKKLELIK